MGKRGKRWIALVLCALWITAMPVFAAGTELPPGAEDRPGEAAVSLEDPEAAPEDGNLPEGNEVPEEAEVPDAPEAPEAPETPEVPEVSETPEVPEEAESPEAPEEVEAPEVPEEVEAPEVPEEAEAPDEPEDPETPEEGENGLHILTCGEDCDGTDCLCPCHQEGAQEPEESLFARLLATENCQALFELMRENQEALPALTAQERTALEEHVRSLPDDGWQGDVLEVLEMLSQLEEEDAADAPQVYATATIHNVPRNAVVAYAYRTAGDSAWNWGGEYSENFDISYSTGSGSNEEFFVFFVKPAENHLLTQFSIVNDASGGTSFDLYSIDCTTSKISSYPDFAALVSQAKAMGYLGFNGYRSSAAGNVILNQYFTGQKPALGLSAVANPSQDVQPGDKVRFTVTLTPETVAGSRVRDFRLTSLSVNGSVYEDVALTANGDGTYTAVVDYTATTEDWNPGRILLNAEANITYEYILPVKDRDNKGSEITTTSTIANSGTAEVSLAPPTATVTVRKLVTGNFGDRNREFAFHLTGSTYGDAPELDFRLKHGEEKIITVNRGDTITLREDWGDYTPSYRVGSEEIPGGEVTLSVTEDCEVVFYNRKEVPLDTGVRLDGAPYVWLLALAGAAACLWRRKGVG